jgi:hypothetical protein
MSSPTFRRSVVHSGSIPVATEQIHHPSNDVGTTKQRPDSGRIRTASLTMSNISITNSSKGDGKRGSFALLGSVRQYMNSTRLMVLLVLCLQNSLFTVLRRYSQGVLREVYSKVSGNSGAVEAVQRGLRSR